MNIIKNLLGFVKSIIKINPLFMIIPIIFIGIILFLKRSRSWKEAFADTAKIFELLFDLGSQVVALFLGLFVRDFQESIGDTGI